MNKVFLIGNLTKDPSISTITDGTALCKFTLAVNRRSGNDETDFFPIIAWKVLAENCSKFLKKGSKAAVIGSVKIRNYDTEDGTKRYITEVIADDVQFLSSRSSDSSVSGGSSIQSSEVSSDPVQESDLPF